jgi:2-oxoacid:acceptor oxidoreductase delta subunit (pyruvate/2-ketoisovalerate family)
MNYSSKYQSAWSSPKNQMIISKTGDWRNQRPVISKGKCRQCGWCSVYCPTMCIKTNSAGAFEVDLNYCKGCGICAYECPGEAITMQAEEVD